MDMDEMLVAAMEDVLVHMEQCKTCNNRFNYEECDIIALMLKDAFESASIMDTLTFKE